MTLVFMWGHSSVGKALVCRSQGPWIESRWNQTFLHWFLHDFFFQFHFSQMTDLASKLLLTVSEDALEFWITLKYILRSSRILKQLQKLLDIKLNFTNMVQNFRSCFGQCLKLHWNFKQVKNSNTTSEGVESHFPKRQDLQVPYHTIIGVCWGHRQAVSDIFSVR